MKRKMMIAKSRINPQPTESYILANLRNHRLVCKFLALFLKASPAIFVCEGCCVLSFSLYTATVSPLFFAFLLPIVGVTICKLCFKNDFPKARRLFITICSFNILMAIVIYGDLIREKGSFYLGSDDAFFELSAYEAMGDESAGNATIFLYFRNQGHTDSSFYYASFVALIHNLTKMLSMTPHTLNPRFINSFFLAFIGIVVWRFGILLGFSNPSAQLSGYLTGFWPLLVFHSAIIRRDTIFAFFLLLSVYLYVSFLQNKSNIKVSKILLLVCSVILVSLLRSGFLSIYLFLFSVTLVLWQWEGINKRNYGLKACSLILLPFVVFYVGYSFGLFHMHTLMDIAEMRYQYSSYTESRGNSSESGLGSLLYRLPVMVSIPARILYASITPLPIPTKFLTYNIRWIGTIPWFLCLPILIRTIFHAIKVHGREFIVFKVLAVSFVTYYAIINIISFTETQQMMYFPFGILLVMYGLENQTWSLRKSAMDMSLVGILLTICYAVLKGFI